MNTREVHFSVLRISSIRHRRMFKFHSSAFFFGRKKRKKIFNSLIACRATHDLVPLDLFKDFYDCCERHNNEY